MKLSGLSYLPVLCPCTMALSHPSGNRMPKQAGPQPRVWQAGPLSPVALSHGLSWKEPCCEAVMSSPLQENKSRGGLLISVGMNF